MYNVWYYNDLPSWLLEFALVSAIPDIIMFKYYHCISIDYSVLSEWFKLHFECTKQYYTLILCYYIQM